MLCVTAPGFTNLDKSHLYLIHTLLSVMEKFVGPMNTIILTLFLKGGVPHPTFWGSVYHRAL